MKSRFHAGFVFVQQVRIFGVRVQIRCTRALFPCVNTASGMYLLMGEESRAPAGTERAISVPLRTWNTINCGGAIGSFLIEPPL